MTLPRFGAVVAILLFSASALSQPQPAHVLSIEDLNFSVEAPDDSWEWSESTAERGRTFFCEHRETGGRLFIIVFGGEKDPYEEQNIKDFVDGVASSWSKRGWEISDSFSEPGDPALGFENVYRFGFRMTSRESDEVHAFGYTVVEGRLFAFLALSETVDEPPELRHVVTSLTILDPTRDIPATEDPPQWLGQMLMLGYFVVLGLCGLVGWAANKLVREPRYNGWLVGIGAIVVLCVILAIRFIPQMPDSVTPFRQGELYGSIIIGPALIPAALGWYLSRRFRKKTAAGGLVP